MSVAVIMEKATRDECMSYLMTSRGSWQLNDGHGDMRGPSKALAPY